LIVPIDVLDEAAPHPHGVGHFVQAPLHGFDHRLVFPTVMRRCLLGVHLPSSRRRHNCWTSTG